MNIVTVEDPIEYRLPGVVQVQVHERAGLTFSAALRSIMRQDPDVILIGEIRDRETAEIAIQASLTGHLVLSTLHTNDAASAVTRLIDIGVASYQIATAIKGVVAQRLLRRRCPDCGSTGCSSCGGIGYRGRLAVAEILVSSPEFERRVAAGAPTESLAEAARASGCISLWESGLELVQRGDTTIEELRRVTAEPVRIVAEPAPMSRGDAAARIVVVGATLARLLTDLRHVAEPFGARVEVSGVDECEGLHAGDVVVASIGALQAGGAARIGTGGLIVALASPPLTGEHVLLLARRADLVLPHDIPARVLLATVLALLRWRG